jgi:mono/diheme cytochrome c family protein
MVFRMFTVLTIVLVAVMLWGFQASNASGSISKGKKVYEQYCLSCHMPDGAGVPRLNPPLRGTTWVTGDKNRLIDVILNGLDEPVDIDGETYQNPMPAQSQLTNQQVADVLTYIRKSFGNNASAVSAAEVASRRPGKKGRQ